MPLADPVPEPPADDELMLAVRAGDLSKLDALFARHFDSAYAFCRRLTRDADAAEDLAQEAFLRVLRYRESFRGDARFTTWLYRICRNLCLTHLERAGRERAGREGWAAEAAPHPTAEDAERAAVVWAALDRLPADRREVLILSRFHGLGYEEIGAVLGCTAGAARVRAHRALAELRALRHEMEPRT